MQMPDESDSEEPRWNKTEVEADIRKLMREDRVANGDKLKKIFQEEEDMYLADMYGIRGSSDTFITFDIPERAEDCSKATFTCLLCLGNPGNYPSSSTTRSIILRFGERRCCPHHMYRPDHAINNTCFHCI
jgi:hypothetical protein